MADNRKYYYLKLKEDFFDTDEMKILESMKDGYLYSNILLKLYLKSLSNSGRLMYRNVIPYTPEILATLTGHQVGTVEKALDVFKKLDLIEMLDNGAIYMMDIQNFIGQSSSEADRQREYYNRMKGFVETLSKYQKFTDIRNVGAAIHSMIENAAQKMDDCGFTEEGEWTYLAKLFGSNAVPGESASVIQQAIKKAEKEGTITSKNRWQLIEYLCADYLSGR